MFYTSDMASVKNNSTIKTFNSLDGEVFLSPEILCSSQPVGGVFLSEVEMNKDYHKVMDASKNWVTPQEEEWAELGLTCIIGVLLCIIGSLIIGVLK